MYECRILCAVRAEEGTVSPEAGVTVIYELSFKDAGTKPRPCTINMHS